MSIDLEQEHRQFEELIVGLVDNNYGCCNDFVDLNTVTCLRNNLQKKKKSGEMKTAGLGKEKNYQKNTLIRGDLINWIEEESQDQCESIFLKKIDRFINHLNTTCFTSIRQFESHYASYERNSFYKRHLDQFKNDNGRKFSVILYLNEDWKVEDGGNLMLYPEDAEQKDIAPFGGRMVFFKSDEMEHEVQPSNTRERNSIAGWFKN